MIYRLPSEVWLGFFDSSLSWLTGFKVVFSAHFFLSYRDIYIIYSSLVWASKNVYTQMHIYIVSTCKYVHLVCCRSHLHNNGLIKEGIIIWGKRKTKILILGNFLFLFGVSFSIYFFLFSAFFFGRFLPTYFQFYTCVLSWSDTLFTYRRVVPKIKSCIFCLSLEILVGVECSKCILVNCDKIC